MPRGGAGFPHAPVEHRLASSYRSIQIAGDHPGALSRIEGLATRTVADQVMVTTNVYGHAKRCFTTVLAGVYDMINHLS